MAIGPILREARQNKQLTTSQVAEMTRMKVQIVDDLENDDFHRIAATIYGKGFIKLYAECVDLDPEPLIDDYMEQVGSPQPPKLPKVKQQPQTSTNQATQTEAYTDTDLQDQADETDASPDDLFSYAVQNRQRKTKVAAKPETAPSPRPSAHTSKTPRAWLTEISTIANKMHQQVKTRITQWLEAALKHFTEAGEHDKWIQRGLIAIGILVVILILIPLGRMLVGTRDTATLPDDELIQFVDPPDLYHE